MHAKHNSSHLFSCKVHAISWTHCAAQHFQSDIQSCCMCRPCAGLVTAEAGQLTGVWLTARCATMQRLDMSMANYWRSLAALAGIGLRFRLAALACLFLVHRQRQR